jgi:hypothetical protein
MKSDKCFRLYQHQRHSMLVIARGICLADAGVRATHRISPALQPKEVTCPRNLCFKLVPNTARSWANLMRRENVLSVLIATLVKRN